MNNTENHADFRMNGIFIGGIYPFSFRGELRLQDHSQSSMFSRNNDKLNKYNELRRRMYDPEHLWRDPSITLFMQDTIESIFISSGKAFRKLAFTAFISTRKNGYGSICFWIEINEIDISIGELIELTALIRGTTERVCVDNSYWIDFYWHKELKQISSFKIICELIEGQFKKEYLKKDKSTKQSTKFVYPLLYIKEIPDCSSSDEIVSKYSKEVAGLVDLWVHDYYFLKKQFRARVTKTDIHPFCYGLTCLSSSCTVEIHPTMTHLIAENEGQTLNDHHLQELFYLFLLSEIAVAQFFLLREYDTEISKLHEKLIFSLKNLLNPLFLIFLIIKSILISNLQKKLIISVNELRYIKLTRKSYLKDAIDIYRNAFGTKFIEDSIEKQLNTITNSINSTYSMLTTIFTLIISIAALAVAFFQVFNEVGHQ